MPGETRAQLPSAAPPGQRPNWRAYLWAAPCTACGLLLAAPLLLAGASLWRRDGILELSVAGKSRQWPCLARRLPFVAITFGHLVIGANPAVLRRWRAHEREHVRQYERWGALFFLAYPAASLWQLLRGHPPYASNHFEVQARAAEASASL